MMSWAAALCTGTLFGFGLALSQMIDRQRVLGFLDVAGTWDPTLACVMAGAAGVALLGFRCVLRRQRPVCDAQFHVPTRRDIDGRLLLGSAVFGVGWGLGGYCPGPGIAAMALGAWDPVWFTAALVAGSAIYHVLHERHPSSGSSP